MINLEYKPLKLDLLHPFGITRETKYSTTNVIVKLTYKENNTTYTGYGEAPPSKFYGETADSVIAYYKWVDNEKILNTDPYDIYNIHKKLNQINFNFAAKSGIDIAIYDLLGKIHHVPAHKYLGFTNKSHSTSYTIGISSLDDMIQKTIHAINAGYDILKIKLGTNIDEIIISSVRDTAPDASIRVDANAAWDLKHALRMVKVLEKNNVELVEQPLASNNLNDLKILRQATILPIIADETCLLLEDVPKLYGLVDGINIKLSKHGGITNSLKILHAAQACHMKIMIGCMIESSLGIAAAGILGTQADYLDLDGCLLLKNDPFNILSFEQSKLIIPEVTGICPENAVNIF